MKMDDYQEVLHKDSIYPGRGEGTLMSVIYCALGLSGEAGEFSDHAKKIWRDRDEGQITVADRDFLITELGDTLWYLARAATELNVSLSEVAQRNLKKIKGRVERGTLRGQGDNR
jgi:NTP pyrophosphatase (non-canonical NTP hydrolase)